MLLNLEYSLKCDAFIGTLASNWCRLVDEMRATVGTYVHISVFVYVHVNVGIRMYTHMCILVCVCAFFA